MLRISNGVMTMTSDVRIEIAERMRGPFDVCECAGHTYINGTLYGMQVCARNELALRDGMRRLAELIDPTCHLMGTTSEEGLYGPTIFHHELSCGHTCDTGWPEPPAHCYECGARVVSGDGE